MKVGTIEGEAQIVEYSGWSYIQDYNLSLQNDGWSLEGGPSSTPTLSNMMVVKSIDTASPLLFGAVLTGEHFNNSRGPDARIVVLTDFNGMKRPYVRWVFEDVVVSSYNTARSGDNILEMVALDYRWITYEYYPFAEDGMPLSPIGFTWDRATNTPAAFGEGGWSQFQFVSEYHETPTPEPTTLAVLTSGLTVLIGRRLIRRRT